MRSGKRIGFNEEPAAIRNGNDSAVRIGVTSQNFRTITGHAGKTRRVLIYEAQAQGPAVEVSRLDLPKAMSLHEFRGDEHPLFSLDLIITASCGEGFVRRVKAHGVDVIATAESDPVKAATAVMQGEVLAPPLPHEH